MIFYIVKKLKKIIVQILKIKIIVRHPLLTIILILDKIALVYKNVTNSSFCLNV